MLKGILSISGKPGLYKLVSQGKGTLIVESLIDGKRIPAYSYAKVIALDDIAVFTEDDDVPLKEVFQSIKEKTNGEKALGSKASGQELKSFFEEVLPDYDRDRVYVSDIKKILGWFNLLQERDLLNLDEEEETTEEVAE